jgi:hypothetical protein
MGNALVSYRLNEDMHLGGDHVGLSLEIAIDQEQSETLRKIPGREDADWNKKGRTRKATRKDHWNR